MNCSDPARGAFGRCPRGHFVRGAVRRYAPPALISIVFDASLALKRLDLHAYEFFRFQCHVDPA
jgi:hypothetical protein